MMEKVRLGDIFEYMAKSKIKAGEGKKEGKYKFFTSSNLQDKFIDEWVYDGEYLIFGTGGKASINYCNEKFSTSTDNFVVKVKKGINTKLIYLYFKNDMQKLEKGFKGASIKHISKDYINQLTIPLYELKFQEKIVKQLDKVQEIIDLRKKQIEELDELIKSQFIEIFGDPFENKNNYEFLSLDNFMERCVDIGSNGANKLVVEHLDMKDTEDYALLVRTLNFTSNDFKNNVKYISKEAYEFFKKSQVYGGEIIFNKIGSAGINFLMPNLNRPVSLGLNQIMITPKGINTRYLYVFLNTEYGEYQIKSRVKGAVTKSIQKTELKKIPVMFPPIYLQNKYENIIKQIDNQKLKIQQNLKQIEILQESLFNKYFN